MSGFMLCTSKVCKTNFGEQGNISLEEAFQLYKQGANGRRSAEHKFPS